MGAIKRRLICQELVSAKALSFGDECLIFVVALHMLIVACTRTGRPYFLPVGPHVPPGKNKQNITTVILVCFVVRIFAVVLLSFQRLAAASLETSVRQYHCAQVVSSRNTGETIIADRQSALETPVRQ